MTHLVVALLVPFVLLRGENYLSYLLVCALLSLTRRLERMVGDGLCNKPPSCSVAVCKGDGEKQN